MSSALPLGIVAGSGLDLHTLLDRIEETRPFTQIPGLHDGPLEGHARTLTWGACDGRPLCLQDGRCHFYEGLDYAAVVRPVDVLFQWGVRTIIFTNAVGGMFPAMHPGSLVAIERLRTWPFVRWRNRPDSIATDFCIEGCDFSGTYWWMHGPSYETRAEIRLLREWGASVVGMSTAPEVMRCHELGIRAAVVSCVTNNCCESHKLTHEAVIAAARGASSRLASLLRRALPDVPERD